MLPERSGTIHLVATTVMMSFTSPQRKLALRAREENHNLSVRWLTHRLLGPAFSAHRIHSFGEQSQFADFSKKELDIGFPIRYDA
jgi:hypothetical protein